MSVQYQDPAGFEDVAGTVDLVTADVVTEVRREAALLKTGRAAERDS